jgi:CubicO group peptidase (beta-lactamase class C family)
MKHSLIFLTILILLCSDQTHARIIDMDGFESPADVLLFPEEEWPRADLGQVGLNSNKVKKLSDFLFSDASMQTDALLIIKAGRLVYQRYYSGSNYSQEREQKHMLWSLTKPISGALAGIAIQQGLIELDNSVADFYPEILLQGSKKSRKYGEQLRVSHLLKMESGLKHTEEAKFRVLSDAIYTYYSQRNYRDVVKGSFRQGFRHPPGTHHNYSTRDPIILMGIIRKSLGDDQSYNDFPWEALFDKLGMKQVTYEQDISGNFLGGMGIWTTAEDLARFGLLLLRNGIWKNEQILPAWWSDYMTTPSLAQASETNPDAVDIHNRDAYGAMLWVNKKLPMNSNRPFPLLPESMFYALGTNGQALIIFPQQDTVIVRLASDSLSKKYKERKAFRDQYMRLISEVLFQ